MRAHYLQHVPFEGLGSIEPWLERSGYEISATRFFETADLPDAEAIDLLIVMGGPMSANDEEDFSWLAAEKRFIRDVVRSGKPVLGICLGAQLLASAMGAKVYRNKAKEIGWFPVSGPPTANPSAFAFPAQTFVFHWHGETFDLPPDALRLARSEACANQAFQIGRTAIGLQFHLETTPKAVRDLVENCSSDLVPERYVQTAERIVAATPETYESINRLMDNVLAFLTTRRTPRHP